MKIWLDDERSMPLGFGRGANEAYQKMRTVADDPKELAKIRRAQLVSCCQDTLAMVRLLEVIGEKAKATSK